MSGAELAIAAIGTGYQVYQGEETRKMAKEQHRDQKRMAREQQERERREATDARDRELQRMRRMRAGSTLLTDPEENITGTAAAQLGGF